MGHGDFKGYAVAEDHEGSPEKKNCERLEPCKDHRGLEGELGHKACAAPQEADVGQRLED